MAIDWLVFFFHFVCVLQRDVDSHMQGDAGELVANVDAEAHDHPHNAREEASAALEANELATEPSKEVRNCNAQG